MIFYSKTVLSAAKWLKTAISSGLTEKEAKRRLEKFGRNRLESKKRRSVIIGFLMQFKDFMVLLLIAAAILSAAVSYYNGGDMSEPLLIMAIVIFNAVIGAIQEIKAEKAIESLKNANPRTSRVLRGGVLKEIPAEELVIGDIIHLSQGDIVPADCRIVSCMAFTVSEASLTGEFCPIAKKECVLDEKTPLAERINTVYMGTSVLTGSAECIVTDTGMDTELGKIAEMLNDGSVHETPLQKKLARIGKILGSAALGICFVIFLIGIIQGRPVLDMFMTAVSLAVAAIPEGLPVTVTIMLAAGVRTMAREKAVVRRLSAVEALGSADVICTDKTGTLTKNKMAVSDIYADDTKKTLAAAALCTDVETGENSKFGDPAEIALVEAAGFNDSLDHPRTGEIPFTSERKMMTVILKGKDGYYAVSKGAPECIVEKCCFANDTYTVLSSGERKEILKKSAEKEASGLRMLAVSYRPLNEFCEDAKSVEKDMCFLGLIGFSDELRPEAEKAVDICRRAGIRTVMITGDSPVTARSVGHAAGIETSGIMTGSEIDKCSDDELQKAIAGGVNIFARTTPEHKLRIVEVFRKTGCVTAMTGDACNDAPALKAADIGCAMGQGGTETAREAADIVLTDDNFATIVKAVKCGRGIYANIKKAVHFLLSSNIGEIITVFASMCFGFGVPPAPVQLLWINLVTDSLPAAALGLEPIEDDIMERGADNRAEIFGKTRWVRICTEGIMIGMLALLAGGIGKVVFGSEAAAGTMTFCTLSISQLVHAFNIRSEKTLFAMPLLSNKWLVGAFFAGLILQAGVVCIKGLNGIFAVTNLTCAQWLCVAGLCLVPPAVVEIEKRICE